MLEKINYNLSVEPSEIDSEIEELKNQLYILQQKIKSEKLPVIIIVEGFGGSGKGKIIKKMISDLDPRNFKVYADTETDASEKRKPFLYRYWNRIPSYGNFSIIERSWYKEISTDAVEKAYSKAEIVEKTEIINTFEKNLSDDGYLIIKFFIYISENRQKKTFKKLINNKRTSFRVTDIDLQRNKNYNKYFSQFDIMLQNTNTSYAPWTVINNNDKKFTFYIVLSTIIFSVNNFFNKKEQYLSFALTDFVPWSFNFKEAQYNKTISFDKKDYKTLLANYQKKLSKLQNTLYRKKIPAIIIFEGIDAAGKSSVIKRLSAALDPRGYSVIPISAPTDEELNYHYLWRFWTNVPKTGHIAIFDRSWYGRVMVEKIEKFTSETRCNDAYNEINEFEYTMYKSGVKIKKFWLQIDNDEQLKRFNERENTPEKKWKITEDDWRNREKWNDYKSAANEMLKKTSTDFALWNVIDTNDKHVNRLEVLKDVIEFLEKITK